MNFSRTELLDILAEANEHQPENRMLSYNALVSAAYRAEARADTKDQVVSLIKEFANDATSSISVASSAFTAECVDLFPDGHWLSGADTATKVAWVAADPTLGPTRSGLVAGAVGSFGDGTENAHAWARLVVLSEMGLISQDLIDTIAKLELEVANG